MATPRRPSSTSRRDQGSPITVASLEPLPAEREGDHWWLDTDGRRLRLSNLDKVFWPDEGYTKGDLLAYYHVLSEAILPYVAGRPLTLKRMPDGVKGSFFYEKNPPRGTPDWVPRCEIESEDGEVDRYLLAEDRAGLLFVANLGCIEFHPLHSGCEAYDEPDWLVFDLDPFPPAGFAEVLVVARHVHAALESLGLPGYPKTSGARGLHVYVGLEPGQSYELSREVARLIGEAVRQADPGLVTTEWEIKRREGHVFVDYNMNRRAASLAAPYSLRSEPGATVSAPLTWEEVEQGVDPRAFTIATMGERLAEVGDLFAPVLHDRVPLAPVVQALGISVPHEEEPPRIRRRLQPPSREQHLQEYERKRRFDATPEPGPGAEPGEGDLFVIQKHHATRLHYDLRLEHEGVLASWAVPRGLPTVPGVKRRAVQTEDHPLAYGSFEGWIPKGNYGAGEVRIFDRGRYELLEWADGKVMFRLHGRRHRGKYHLVRTRDDWLVFLSKESADEQLPAPPAEFAPMLAESGAEPFVDPGWRFEPKLDGVRTLAYVSPDGTRLVSRRRIDQSRQYPELGELAAYLNVLNAVADGEIVALDEAGRPSFERLQQRMNLANPRDVERARTRVPVRLFLFDLLWLDGEDLTVRPLEERRAALQEVTTEDGPVSMTYFVDGGGTAFFEAAKGLGFEGVVAKRLGSRYLPGRRSRDWRKIKAFHELDCVILGWTEGTGRRAGALGALVLGAYRGDQLVEVGEVGTGFTDRVLAELKEELEKLETERVSIAARGRKGAHWVRPELVCRVAYAELTSAGKLRAPSFKGLRRDKAPEECVLPERAEELPGGVPGEDDVVLP